MAREICEIVSVEEERPGGPVVRRVMGTYVLEGGQLSVKAADPQDARTLRGLLDTPGRQSNHGGDAPSIDSRKQPELWFRRLPYTFHGTYLYARMAK